MKRSLITTRRNLFAATIGTALGASQPRVPGMGTPAGTASCIPVIAVFADDSRFNPDLPHLSPVRGNVIQILPDGWNFSHLERTAEHLRLLRVPGLAMARAQMLLTPATPRGDGFNRRWSMYLDFGHPATHHALLQHVVGPRMMAIHTVRMSPSEFWRIVTPHPPIGPKTEMEIG